MPPPPPKSAWSLPMSTRPIPLSVSTPTVLDTIALLPLAARVGSYVYREHSAGRTPIFDLNGPTLSPPLPKSHAGVPLGGIGGGAIGRGINGDFRRWSITPGRYRHYLSPSCVFVCKIDGQAVVLSTTPRVPQPLSSWTWGRDTALANRSTYHALYPRSWTTYVDPTNAGTGITITQRQISPFLPHNYTDSSLPTAVFEFDIVNDSDTDHDVSLFFSFENTDGGDEKDDKEHAAHIKHSHSQVRKSADDVTFSSGFGVTMGHVRHRKVVFDVNNTPPSGSCCPSPPPPTPTNPNPSYDEHVGFAILTPPPTDTVKCSRLTAYNPADEAQTTALWRHFIETGDVPCAAKGFQTARTVSDPSTDRQSCAVCQRTTVKAGARAALAFSVAWDSPVAWFGSGAQLPRRHAMFFKRQREANASYAPAIGGLGLMRYKRWEEDIERWQKPILDNDELPAWFKGQLFNELYYLADGGTIWTDSTSVVANDAPATAAEVMSGRTAHTDVAASVVDFDSAIATAIAKMEEVERKTALCQGASEAVGQFLYLEGHEYVMYNTSDVHFYASFALAANFPQLQLSVLRDYGKTVKESDGEVRTLLGGGVKEVRKVAGALVHDLGSPCEHPVLKVNAYNFQDVSRWKDLPSKFVLMVARDAGDNVDFVRAVWEDCVSCMDRAARLWDKDGDGMIKNEGFPDQTYDVWIADGVSAYTGGLWVAANFGMSKLAKMMGEEEKGKVYEDRARRAKTVYNDLLWNGEYFNYSQRDKNSQSIMADQLCGQWWSRVCGLESVVDSRMKAVKTLKKVHQMNVLRWKELCGGVLNGAVNGMRPDGRVDGSCLQSKEVWTGTTYAVASCMILESAACGTGEEEERQMLMDMAFETSRGVFEAGWERFGYSFATPEAWDRNGKFRSLGYMRPLCIWGMNWGDALAVKGGKKK